MRFLLGQQIAAIWMVGSFLLPTAGSKTFALCMCFITVFSMLAGHYEEKKR
jgi:hypothetical protein